MKYESLISRVYQKEINNEEESRMVRVNRVQFEKGIQFSIMCSAFYKAEEEVCAASILLTREEMVQLYKSIERQLYIDERNQTSPILFPAPEQEWDLYTETQDETLDAPAPNKTPKE